MLWATALTQFDEALTTAFLIIFTVLALVGYPLVWETATRGRSVGKIVMGLRVVSDDGGPERFRQALFRALASVVEIWMLLGSPAVICSMLSPKAKRVGDVFAGTVVVSERGPRLGPPPVMPPSLAWWASSLQLSGLTAGQAEVARQFLVRAPQLDPALREQMAYRIAGDVVARIAPPPPPGVPPQLVLAAVLAERHRRELLRLRPTLASRRTGAMGPNGASSGLAARFVRRHAVVSSAAGDPLAGARSATASRSLAAAGAGRPGILAAGLAASLRCAGSPERADMFRRTAKARTRQPNPGSAAPPCASRHNPRHARRRPTSVSTACPLASWPADRTEPPRTRPPSPPRRPHLVRWSRRPPAAPHPHPTRRPGSAYTGRCR